MRLIDADAMLKRNKNSIYDTADLEEMLHYEPTAYDVDKVVDELKKNKVNCKNSGTIFDTWDYVKLEKAIESVKRGGGMSKETISIILSEKHIAQLINGEELSFEVDGKEIKVRQSYLKDIAADILKREIRVMNTTTNTFEY